MKISESYKKVWKVMLLQGVAAVLFSVVALTMPAFTLLAVTLAFGLWAVLDGIVEIGYAFTSRNWWRIGIGLFGMASGVFMIFDPQFASFALVLLLAGWLILRGVLDIVDAIRLRRQLSNEWLLIIGGIVSVLAGITFVAFPMAAGSVVIVLLGAFAAVYGGLMIIDAISIREKRSSSGAVSAGHV